MWGKCNILLPLNALKKSNCFLVRHMHTSWSCYCSQYSGEEFRPNVTFSSSLAENRWNELFRCQFDLHSNINRETLCITIPCCRCYRSSFHQVQYTYLSNLEQAFFVLDFVLMYENCLFSGINLCLLLFKIIGKIFLQVRHNKKLIESLTLILRRTKTSVIRTAPSSFSSHSWSGSSKITFRI